VARLAEPSSCAAGSGVLGWHGPAFDVEGYLLWGFTGGVVDALLRIAGWDRGLGGALDRRGTPGGAVTSSRRWRRPRNGENLAPAVSR
jgi:hypothetical protein